MHRFSGILYNNSISNNGTLSSKRAMPQKDITSDGTSTFAMNRHNYMESYSTTSMTTSEQLFRPKLEILRYFSKIKNKIYVSYIIL